MQASPAALGALRAARHPAARRAAAAPARAAADGPERKLDFGANRNAGVGFVESDSAGQTNVFAVEPKQYVAGGKADETRGEANDTTAVAAVAGTFGMGIVVAGLLLTSGPTTLEAAAPAGDARALSSYAAQFSAELAPAAPAAAPALADAPAE